MVLTLISDWNCIYQSSSSDGFVWIQHDSHFGSHSLAWKIFAEISSDDASVSMSAHDLAPVNSILGIIYGILGLLNVSNSLAHVPSGTGLILALIDAQQSLMHVLSNSIPSESGKDSSLVQSDWLSLLITLLLAFSSFGHGSFCIMIIQ